jgi:hypothetical protein
VAFPSKTSIFAILSGGAGNSNPSASIGGAESSAPGFDRPGVFVYQGIYTGTFPDQESYKGGVLPGMFLTVPDGWYVGNSFLPSIKTKTDPHDQVDFYLDQVTGPLSAPVNRTLYDTASAGDAAKELNANFMPLYPIISDISVQLKFSPNYDALINDISTSVFSAGATIYRCFYLHNFGGTTLPSLLWYSNSSWYDNLTVQFGVDPHGAGGTASAIANQFTAPTSVVFCSAGGSHPISSPALSAGNKVPMWLKLTIPPGFSATVTKDKILQENAEAVSAQWTWSFALGWTYGAGGSASFESLVDSLALSGIDTETGAEYVDVLSLFDSAYDNLVINKTETDTFAFSSASSSTPSADTVSITKALSEIHMEELDLSDAQQENGVFNITVTDEFSFETELTISGETYEGWVVNLETNAASFYEWGRFSSFTKFNGKYYGTTDEGLFELNGDTDNGTQINAFIDTGVSDMDIQFDKRVLRAYVGIRLDGAMLLKTVVGDNVVRTYRLIGQNKGMVRQRVPLGRGVDSVYGQFTLENVDGVDFELDCIQVFPVVMGRRFR